MTDPWRTPMPSVPPAVIPFADTMNIDLDNACDAPDLPAPEDFRQWAEAAVAAAQKGTGDIAIRIVDAAEIQTLNRDYRHQDKPTNVLSFPFDMPAGVTGLAPILGDLAICAEVVVREAAEQHKPVVAHWAHLVVHGTLHLLGFDHIEDDEAEIMEALEIRILEQLGFDDPYRSP